VFISKNKRIACQGSKNSYLHGGLRHADIIIRPINFHSSEEYRTNLITVHGRYRQTDTDRQDYYGNTALCTKLHRAVTVTFSFVIQ